MIFATLGAKTDQYRRSECQFLVEFQELVGKKEVLEGGEETSHGFKVRLSRTYVLIVP